LIWPLRQIERRLTWSAWRRYTILSTGLAIEYSGEWEWDQGIGDAMGRGSARSWQALCVIIFNVGCDKVCLSRAKRLF
jgi:hypothetical protein